MPWMRSLSRGCAMRGAALALLTLGAALAAQALINEKYPPEKMYMQADWVVRADLGPVAEEGALPVKVTQVVKGANPAIPALTPDEVDAQLMPELLAAIGEGKTASGLLMVGDFNEAILESGGELENKPVGAMLVGTHWFALFPREGGLRIGMDPLTLKAVWAGGDVTLEELFRYFKTDAMPAKTPVKMGTAWARDTQIGTLDGRASGMQVLDIFGTGKNALFIGSADGDRLYAQGADGALTDVTAKTKLDTKSTRFAWLDVNGDGKQDLVSWDGAALTLRVAAPDDTFGAMPVNLAVPEPCVGLVPLSVGGAPAVLVAAPRPQLAMRKGRAFALAALPEDPTPLEEPGFCVVADFDGDRQADVVQVGANGARFYKRTGAETFAAPTVACEANLGEGITSASLGDFNQDGRPDVLVSGRVGASFLINLGDGSFREMYAYTGEVTYISKTDMVGATVGDINNDGRHDVVFYYANMNNQVFFNRGFRCFGHALSMENNAGLPCAKSLQDGQQTGTVGDLNGDGAEDLATISVDGAIWVLTRETKPGLTNTASALGLTVTLPKGQVGPVTLVAYDGTRCLGARVVTSSTPAFFGKMDKGPLKLVWRTAAGEQTKMVTVMKAQRLELAGLE